MSFASELKSFSDKAIKNTDRVRRAAIIEILNGVVLTTPVKSGRAKGNWQTTVNSPASGVIEGVRSPAAVEAEGRANMGEMKDTVFITNNLPYIGKLNEGSSKQAPARFVESEVARVAANLRKNGISTEFR